MNTYHWNVNFIVYDLSLISLSWKIKMEACEITFLSASPSVCLCICVLYVFSNFCSKAYEMTLLSMCLSPMPCIMKSTCCPCPLFSFVCDPCSFKRKHAITSPRNCHCTAVCHIHSNPVKRWLIEVTPSEKCIPGFGWGFAEPGSVPSVLQVVPSDVS